MKKKLLFSLLALLCSVGAWAIDNTKVVGDIKYKVDFGSYTATVLQFNVSPSHDAIEEVRVPEYIQLPYSRDELETLYIKAVESDAFKLAQISRLYLPSKMGTLLCNCFKLAYIGNVYLKSEHAPALGTDLPDATQADPKESLGLINKPHLFVVNKEDYTGEAWTSQFNRISRLYDGIVDGVAVANIGTEDNVNTIVVEKEEPYTGDVVIPDEAVINGKTYSITGIDDGVFEDSGDQMTTLTLGTNLSELGNQFLKGVTLNTLICKSPTPPHVEWGDGVSINEIQVPCAYLSAYREAEGWSDFADKIVGYRVVIDGIKYEYDSDDKTASIVKLNATSAEELSIPKSMTYNDEEYAVTSIKAGALTDCTLKRIFLPETIKSVEVNCFSGSTIDNIYIYNTTEVTKIEGEGRLGLRNWPNLFVKVYPSSIYRWKNSSWSSIAKRISPVPGAVVDGIAYFLYGPYDDLGQEGTATVVPNETPYTGDITIPDEIWSNGRRFPVTELGELAFAAFADNRYDLKTLTINQQTKYIRNDCFKGVYMDTLTILNTTPPYNMDPRQITWGSGFYVSTIKVPYKSLQAYRTDGSFEEFANKIVPIPVVKDGIAYEFYLDNLQATVAANNYKGDVTIPATVEHDGKTFNVTAIAKKAFYNCNELTSISLPNSINTLGESCFQNCTNLVNVKLPDELKELPSYGFYNCNSLRYLELPDGLERVDDKCFCMCADLKTLIFPESVNYLGQILFEGSGIDRMAFVNPDPALDECMLFTINNHWLIFGKTCDVYMPGKLIEGYKTKDGWKEFKNFYPIEDTPVCAHTNWTLDWVCKEHNNVPIYANFTCDYCSKPVNNIEVTLGEKEITQEPTCTETGLYNQPVKAIDPNGKEYEMTVTDLIIPALHTSNVGHCDVCGEEIGDHLAFKAVNGDVTVGVKSNHWDGVIFPLEYSTDRITWNQMDGDVTIFEGSVAFFRSGYDVVMGDMHRTTFTMTSDNGGLIEASGNIMSLLDKTCASTTVGGSGFEDLFNGCTPLLTAPKLPATEIARFGYCGMFQGCTNFNCDVDLPALAIYPGSYENMFKDCSSMSSSIIVRAKVCKDPVADIHSMKVNSYFSNWILGTAGVSVYIDDDGNDIIEMELNPRNNTYIVKWGYITKELTLKDTERTSISVSGDEEYVDNLTIERSMIDNGWYTICLPFDISLKDSPFSQAAEFDKIDGNTYKFSSVSELKMGVGYIVKVDHEMPKLTFQRVKIPKNLNEHIVESDFQGIFSPTDIEWSSYVIGSGNTVNPISGSNHLKGFRAYFKNAPEATDAKTFRFTVDDNDDDIATSISLPLRESQSGAIYNLQGQRVNASHRGIVIKNGKKYVR